jgi:hypothetical protein
LIVDGSPVVEAPFFAAWLVPVQISNVSPPPPREILHIPRFEIFL